MTNRNIGQQIKTIRALRNITQTELGQAIGVSHVTISYIENGLMQPNADLLARIKAVLNWPSDEAVNAAFELLAAVPDAQK